MYKTIEELVEKVDERNTDNKISELIGVSIDKCFIKSVANTNGTDLSKYKIIRKNDFAVSLMQVSRDSKIPIARLEDYDVAIMSPAYPIFRVKDTSVVLPEYLEMWFKRPEFDREAAFIAVGGVRGSMPWEEFAKMKLPVPPMDKQKNIVKAYKTITDRIALKQKINDNLEAQVSAIYHSMFEERNEWPKGSVSDFGEIVGGATPSKDIDEYFCSDGIVWLTPKDLTSTGNKFIYKGETDITEAAYHSCSTKLLPKGSVLLSSRAPVGCVAIAMTDLCTNQGFKSIIPKSEFGTAFVYYFLKENRQLLESHSSGTTFMEISGNVLKAIPVSIPPEELTKKFSSICEPIFAYQEQIEAEIFQLLELQRTMVSQISSR
jgi:type I restriction enzyme S subunit